MLSYTILKPYSYTYYKNKPYYTFKIFSYASYMYDFKLKVKANDYDKITGVTIDVYGNPHDAYSIKLWPENYKKTNNYIIYDIAFWCSNISTPLIKSSCVNGGGYITIYTTALIDDMQLLYTNCTNILNDELTGEIRHDAYSHSEERIISGQSIELRQAIDDTYIIHANGQLTIKLANETIVNCIDNILVAKPQTITIYHHDSNAILAYKLTNYWIVADVFLYMRYLFKRIIG